MTTLQEQFEKDYPDKEAVYINAHSKYWYSDFVNRDLDLREYVNVAILELSDNKISSIKLPKNSKIKRMMLGRSQLTQIDLSQQEELMDLDLNENNLTSIGFLNTLPNPEKLESLYIFNNKIQPTDISIFSRFVNLKTLMIGTSMSLDEKRNHFYGSLKSYQNLTKLENVCIEATDVNEGLEYLPTGLIKKSEIEKYSSIQCRSFIPEARCSFIQNQLRKYDYDIKAWQLAHPAEMFRARSELFAMEDSKEKWLSALNSKIEQTQEKIKEVKKGSPDKFKKIKRLNTKLGELNVVKQLLEERKTFEDSLAQGVRWYDKFKEDKATQTEYIVLKNND